MKIGQIACAALFVFGLTATGTASAGKADFTLVNNTGLTISEIYISPTHKGSWGPDQLGKSNLDNGKSRTFKFKATSDHCNQDLKVIFADSKTPIIWEEDDLCALNKITLKYNRKTGDVSAVKE